MHKPQKCYSKIESTGLGMNVRHIISNLSEEDAREIYFSFYVKRGEASENRIRSRTAGDEQRVLFRPTIQPWILG